jgi:hypothetical protein
LAFDHRSQGELIVQVKVWLAVFQPSVADTLTV